MTAGLQLSHVIILGLIILAITVLITGAAVGIYALCRHLIRQARR